jgi:hypothetical protein
VVFSCTLKVKSLELIMSEADNVQSIASLLEKFAKLNVANTPGVVAMPTADGDDYVTLKFGLQHYVNEGKKLKISESDLLSSSTLATKMLKIDRFLQAAEKQIGTDNVAAVTAPFFGEVFDKTSLADFAEENVTWRETLTSIRAFFQIEEVDDSHYFYDVMAINPDAKTTIKTALIKMVGLLKRAIRENAIMALPPPRIIAKKIVNWFPPTSHAIIPRKLLNITHNCDWVEDVLPLITMLAIDCPTDLKSREKPKPNTAPVSASSHATTAQHSHASKSGGTFSKGPTKFATNSSVIPPPPPPPQPSATPKASVPPTKAFVPAKVAAPVSKPVPKSLGRLMREKDFTAAEFRIDPGADSHCFGKDLIPYIHSRKPSTSNYTVLLQRAATKPESCKLDVSVKAVNGDSHSVTLSGIVNAANNLSVLSCNTLNVEKGNGIFELVELPGVIMKAYGKSDFPYAQLTLGSQPKTLSSFLHMMGFVSEPTPDLSDVASAVHLKLGCAGVDSLNATTAILGYEIPRRMCAAACAKCLFCPSKQLHAPVGSISSEIAPVIPSTVPVLDPDLSDTSSATSDSTVSVQPLPVFGRPAPWELGLSSLFQLPSPQRLLPLMTFFLGIWQRQSPETFLCLTLLT